MLESGSIPVLDAIIVAIYLVLTFGFGIFARNLLHSDTKGEEGYYLAGRKMPGWLTGISTAVTAMNSDVAPTYCGMAVVVGLSISWFYLSRFGLALMIAAMLFAVRWRQTGISTGPEFYALRFSGRAPGFVRGYSSIYGVMVGMVPWIGAGMLGVHMIFGPIFGIESKAIPCPLFSGAAHLRLDFPVSRACSLPT
jgi:Na+/proline symporter